MLRDASEVLDRLLEGGRSTVAGRLAGALRSIGRDRIADEIVKTMRTAGYDVRERDPFETQIPAILPARESSPYGNRIRLMWQEMRETIIHRFPAAPGIPKDTRATLKRIEDISVADAYHSLSIEGYRVTPELIERVRSGPWNPDGDVNDREHRNALAARGYWQAYQAVRESVTSILDGKNSGTVVDEDHRDWYREMFAHRKRVIANINGVLGLAIDKITPCRSNRKHNWRLLDQFVKMDWPLARQRARRTSLIKWKSL